jgi:carboxymethylenebutenolidase
MVMGRPRKFSRNGVLQKGTASLLEIRLCLGEQDEFISKTAQAQIKVVLAKKPNATVYSYSGQRHAFSRHDGAHHNAAAAAMANGRTSEFLKQQLQ